MVNIKILKHCENLHKISNVKSTIVKCYWHFSYAEAWELINLFVKTKKF